MKTKAAILWEPHTDYIVDEIELDGPKDHEVLVEYKACGMCHSDEHLVTGDMALPTEVTAMLGWQQYPIICGHEGAGVVQEVGPNVSTLAVGDHVVTSFVPSCGKCPSCVAGHSNLCDLGTMLLAGTQLDGTFRHHTKDGKDLALMCCLGAFAHHGVLNEASLVKVDPDIPLEKAALVAPHFAVWVRQLLEQRYGPERLYREGFQVITSIDLRLQSIAEATARAHVAQLQAQNKNVSNASLVALDVPTGQVLAMLGSLDYFDPTIQGQVNVALASRQPGSSFKPITYATAFSQGYTPATMILDVRTDRTYDPSLTRAHQAVRLPPDHVAERASELDQPRDSWLVAYCA